ncbi:riboflavin biosynthesis pyrimidine reductase [Mycetocola sp. CAN_C7]|uniref:pyrimidine reductase family protein n=1 Tax=Mycetocola sp. CAN_C7 TaxID=2787724 RepID=UPI0018C92A71
MTEPAIRSLVPGGGDLDDGAILELYTVADRTEQWLRVNFISSVDGAATSDGLSAGLGSAADLRVFDLLRRLCDVVVVGAGTVRAEGYGPMRLESSAVDWRRAHGLPAHPVFAIVSAGLDLDPESRIFTDAPVRPIVITVEGAPIERRKALSVVADVLIAGTSDVDPTRMLRLLAERGLAQVHCEGGPRFFADLVRGDAVDEICLTIGPALEGPGAPRIVAGATATERRPMDLAHVLESDGTLLLRYTRPHTNA